MIQRRTPGQRVRLAFRILVVTALIAAFAQVTLGGIVRVTDSGLACPDWPLCHGRIIPPFELTTLIEYSHRLSASALGVLAVAAAAMAWIYYRSNSRILFATLLGLALVLVASALGGVVVLTELDRWLVLFHLGIAEALVACMVAVLVVGWSVARRSPAHEPTVRETDRFNLLVLATLVGTIVLILSGSYMVGYGAGSSCGTWPLCRGSLVPDGTPYAIHMGHRFLAALVGMLIVATVFSAWSRRAQRPELGWAGLLLAFLFIGQVLVGAGTVWAGFANEMRATHLALATLVWIALVFLSALVYAPQRFELGRVLARPRPVSELERLTP